MTVGLIAGSAGGCAEESERPSPAPPVSREAVDRHDTAIDRQLETMRRAAASGDRAAVARAQSTLERLAQTHPAAARTSSARDPFERMLEDFPFKRPPLVAQQVTTTRGDRRVFAGVDRAAFCLLTPAARREAVEAVHRPADARLRTDGITDFELVVVALTRSVATLDQALAIGRGNSVRLTSRGRSC